MKYIASLLISATLLCAGSPIAPKPHHSHRKLYMMLAMTAASALTSYEMYSHTHHSPMAPTLPNPPAPIKPDLFLITCGVCNGKKN